MSESGRPLRIGLLTHSVHPRGGVVHTLELATALHRAGHAVTVLAPATPGQRMFRTPPCQVELVPVNASPRNTVDMVRSRIDAFVAHLEALLQHQAFDVLHTQDSIGGNALAQLQDAGHIDGFVRTVHHLDTFDDPQLARWQQTAFERASLVLSGSRLWCEHLASAHGIEAHQIDNGVDTRRFSPAAQDGDAALARRLGIATGAPVVLAVGGIEERKNSVRLLAGFALLRKAHPRAQLVIAGGASLLDHAACAQAFRAQMQASGFDEGPWQPLRVTGPLPDAEVAALYRLADVVAMPSLREGFGLVVLEALASGVPVVASRIAPFTEHLAETDVSWADPHDAASIADALAHALAHRDPQRIAASAERLARRFSWSASAERHVALYRRHRARLKEKPPCP